MVIVVDDKLDWYGFDEFGGFVYDVIGMCCDFYIGCLLFGLDYYYCCYLNLICVLFEFMGLFLIEVEFLVYDVLNVFMCMGFL